MRQPLRVQACGACTNCSAPAKQPGVVAAAVFSCCCCVRQVVPWLYVRQVVPWPYFDILLQRNDCQPTRM